MASNINRVCLTGNLTRDPELRGSGTTVCAMRIAVNSRVKDGDGWADKANYVDVVCFGNQADNCKKYLAKGRPIAVDGRLDWSEWTTQDGQKRQALQVIADSVQFLSDGQRDGDQGHAPAVGGTADQAPPPVSPPVDPALDDIPFRAPIVPLAGIDHRGTTHR